LKIHLNFQKFILKKVKLPKIHFLGGTVKSGSFFALILLVKSFYQIAFFFLEKRTNNVGKKQYVFKKFNEFCPLIEIKGRKGFFSNLKKKDNLEQNSTWLQKNF